MPRIAICDDQFKQRQIISEYIEELSKVYPDVEYDCYLSGDDLFDHYDRTTADGFYDIIYLDIEMEGSNGVLTASKIREIDKKALIVYVTSFKQYVLEASDTYMFRFLLKPVPRDKFYSVFEDAYKTIGAKGKTYTFMHNYKKTRVFTEDIIYFEIAGRKLLLHTTDEDYWYYGKIKVIAEELKDYGFCLIHASYLVNMAQIHQLEYEQIILLNKTILPVSPARSKPLQIAFADFERGRCNI